MQQNMLAWDAAMGWMLADWRQATRTCCCADRAMRHCQFQLAGWRRRNFFANFDVTCRLLSAASQGREVLWPNLPWHLDVMETHNSRSNACRQKSSTFDTRLKLIVHSDLSTAAFYFSLLAMLPTA
jgi:hypothetical protein